MSSKSDVVEGFDILIDDSCWGNPLGGILQGAYSFKINKFITREIGVEHFQVPNFDRKTYLKAVAEASLDMLTELCAENDDRILVCRGYCNIGIKPLLLSKGYQNVSNGVIGEPLQTMLEDEAKVYIERIGYNNCYYDPKGMEKKTIISNFNGIIKWVVENNRFDIAKTGWKYFTQRKYDSKF